MSDHSTDDPSPSGFVTRLWIVPALALLFPPVARMLAVILFPPASFLASLFITLTVGAVVLIAVFTLIMSGETNLTEQGVLAAVLLALMDVGMGLLGLAVLAVSR